MEGVSVRKKIRRIDHYWHSAKTSELWKEYFRQVEESEGFEVGYFPGGNIPIFCRFYCLPNAELCIKPAQRAVNWYSSKKILDKQEREECKEMLELNDSFPCSIVDALIHVRDHGVRYDLEFKAMRTTTDHSKELTRFLRIKGHVKMILNETSIVGVLHNHPAPIAFIMTERSFFALSNHKKSSGHWKSRKAIGCHEFAIVAIEKMTNGTDELLNLSVQDLLNSMQLTRAGRMRRNARVK